MPISHPYIPPDQELSNQPATRGRYVVLSFLGAMTFVLYLDRVCIGQASTDMQRDLNISNSDMGLVFAAFTLAYGLFEVPVGRLGDVWGARGVLTRIVLWWSGFTILTGFARGFYSLAIIRFLFGAGEAGALPNSAKVLSRWFPESNRGMAQSVVTTCMMIGGALSPYFAAKMIKYVGWRETFYIFGGLGIVWAIPFWLWFRDEPSEHPSVNRVEVDLITAGRGQRKKEAPPPIPWIQVLTNPNVWLMGTIMTCNSAVFYMVISWYSNYLQKARSVPADEAGTLTSLVLAGGALGCLIGGPTMDLLIRITNNRRFSRSILAVSALSIGAFAMWLGVNADSPKMSAACLSVASMTVQLQSPAWWSTVTQISGRHLGALFGLMNSMGVVGASASQLLLGYLTDHLTGRGYTGRDVWDPGMYAYGFVLLTSASLWLFVNPNRRIDDHE